MEPSPSAARRTRISALLVLLGVAWLLIPAWLVLSAVGEVLTFFGEVPTDEQRARSDRLLVAAVLTAIVVALAGALVGLWERRPLATTAFGVALLVAVVAAVPVLEAVQPEPPRSAIPFREPGGACQEHSGGDTRCPGG